MTCTNTTSGEVNTYTCDAVGNLLSMGAGVEVIAFTYDPVNRLTSMDGVGYTWDSHRRCLARNSRVWSGCPGLWQDEFNNATGVSNPDLRSIEVRLMKLQCQRCATKVQRYSHGRVFLI